MNHLQKLITPLILKWVSLDYVFNNSRPSKTILWASGSFHIAQKVRFYATKKKSKLEQECNIPRAVRKEAQAALLEYLHSTRNLQFMDAEYMSKNSPFFLSKLLERVDNETDIRRSLTRFLRYHPINEFEPFFESMGLKPCQYLSFLPRDLMFLNDDQGLLDSYHVLCNYGISRNKIGRIFAEAPEVFRYDPGVLDLKLRSFQGVGLDQSNVVKLVSASPHLLIGNVHKEFFEVVEKLKTAGVEYSWIEAQLKGNSIDWGQLLDLMCLLNWLGLTDEQLGKLICQVPHLLFDCSGRTTFLLIGFLSKFGFEKPELLDVFLHLPQIPIKTFVFNMRQCYQFLIEIEMPVVEIGSIVHSYPTLLGSCVLKKATSLLTILNTGKKRLCSVIKENPEFLRNLVRGAKVEKLPIAEEEVRSKMMKMKFLLDLGFAENSSEMEKALKVFRGKGVELQERFDCLVNAGLDRKHVASVLKIYPQILNQRKEVLEAKIDFLVNKLGYPLSALVSFPSYLNYTIPRIRLRLSMYNWLRDQGMVDARLALSTIIASSEKLFMKAYVNPHPKGLEVWQDLKREIYTD
ncbi:transcription termination factor MTEF18, mitochondrial-like [Lycium barbarum]|uniref:transcription termination factor MTEF18, mitochondrial-like n=1 Tax=Lycium barbarum TaxID=112863 RepID=UPI00293E8778|nr:transcription termination factor MTEF18, mitochondrial-like [Lycium barbarum]XP_060208305.1 transcription termination factor MTEF18, mitochondrial-like [Lycium barbarum]XP_060208313.1 transcription termination factor MTEF18, mitochondrial-like [Lycium barbarum]